MTDPELETIRTWLAGIYTNRQQAQADPVWYIPVTLWYVPLESLFKEGVGFFTEQINEHFPEKFYRSRVLQLVADPLRLENYQLINQATWLGASQDQHRLSQLTLDDLNWLPGCRIHLEKRDDHYHGQMEPGLKCKLTAEATSAIEIEFDLSATTFITLDRGIDLQTQQQTWGSKAGPYHYIKQQKL